MPLMRNRMVMTPSPTKIQISKMCDIPNILPPLSSAQQKLLTTKGTKVHEENQGHFTSCIFASFLVLSDQFQVVHDFFRLTMAKEYFSVGQHEANTGIAPNVRAPFTDAANAVTAHRIPGRDRIRLDVLQRNRAQAESERADFD